MWEHKKIKNKCNEEGGRRILFNLEPYFLKQGHYACFVNILE